MDSQDIEMEIGIEKCAILIMRSGKWHMTECIKVPNTEKKKNMQILEADPIK